MLRLPAKLPPTDLPRLLGHGLLLVVLLSGAAAHAGPGWRGEGGAHAQQRPYSAPYRPEPAPAYRGPAQQPVMQSAPRQAAPEAYRQSSPAGEAYRPAQTGPQSVARPAAPQVQTSPYAAAQRAIELNGGGRVLAVDPDGSGYRVKVLKQGEMRVMNVPGNR